MIINYKHIIKKIKAPFQEGLSTKEVTKAIIVSLLFTVFPVFGVTTLLITLVSVKLKLNLPIMIVVSYLASPLQYLFFLPFIHFGESIMDINHTLLTIQEIKNAYDVSFFNTMQSLFFELVCGVSGWLLIALPISLLALFLNNKISSNYCLLKK
ncbi:DUF2062 domain-containing protein [Polaribacter sp. MSW13]|uniref:DUF2062 domain-containing protein n=1 Tax=Polaribacter marinus TaxID=2916838 RepID=A0A9X1VPX7_9FLAO|nr:DUF2062 domain-containing protein [Polaribacter marinus]MCI2230043.1 DUF2062 domain-containing protein [Polaribacter marinus]